MSTQDKALEACRLLVDAYHRGEDAGSIDWNDVDEAFELASQVVAETEAENT